MIRFKITCESSRVYYTYADDAFQARQRFEAGKPTADTKGNLLTLDVRNVEEDEDEWKTSLVENWAKARPG